MSILIKSGVNLKKITNYKIGGKADYIVSPKNLAEILESISWAKKNKIRKIFILGSGTNVLFSDEGYRGLIIIPKLNYFKKEGNEVIVGGGVLVKDFLNFLIKNGLEGFEWAGGLPGTIGGAVRGNAGCFGGETKDNLVSVTSVNFKSTPIRIIKRKKQECNFDYRSSIFKIKSNEIILECRFKFINGNKSVIKKIVNDHIKYRNSRHPMDKPNIGSIFKNTPVKNLAKKMALSLTHKIKHDPFPVVPTVYFIAEANLRGKRHGGAMISDKHPNFIVNYNNKAKASDVIKLMKFVKSTLKKKFNINVEPEVMIVK